MSVTIPVSWGELLDKITILRIKKERLADPEKRRNVLRELAILEEAWQGRQSAPRELAELAEQLRSVNEALWDIEDEIRDCERRSDFGQRFVELARKVYRTNDRRASLKYRVNDLLGSDIVEEKAYQAY
ncbi:DUF6165 family protein [Desulfofustis glycolicus]|uniref:Uncharacterized protein n=1 Tax=Desulfofustis glycolicus DSM 9705 TaxID=1121409 RepID=A0A1M5VGT4_9BACT|nr:DUF6165 family protein [Desulfofustis glycolicus]SHH74436.1 hypothetical protein SAMN02745124_01682 [Desulfofustis glycolicus DSM 9705]